VGDFQVATGGGFGWPPGDKPDKVDKNAVLLIFGLIKINYRED